MIIKNVWWFFTSFKIMIQKILGVSIIFSNVHKHSSSNSLLKNLPKNYCSLGLIYQSIYLSFVVLKWGFCEYSRKNDTRTKWNVSLIYLISYVRDDNKWATGCAMICLPFYHSVMFVQCVMADLLNPRAITP